MTLTPRFVHVVAILSSSVVLACGGDGTARPSDDDDGTAAAGPGGSGAGGQSAGGGAVGGGAAGGGGAGPAIDCIAQPAAAIPGMYDGSFANGVKTIPLSSFGTTYVQGVRRDADDRILVYGWGSLAGFQHDLFVVRFTAEGALDTTFGQSGAAHIVVADQTASANHLTLDGQGRIYVAGKSGSAGWSDGLVVRLTANGVVDTSFGAGGSVLVTAGGEYPEVSGAVALPDGVLVSGAGSTGGFLLRYGENGVLDTTYPSLYDSVGFTAMALGDGALFVSGYSRMRKLDFVTNALYPGWSQDAQGGNNWQLAPLVDGGVAALGSSTRYALDATGALLGAFPGYISLFSERTMGVHCDGRLLIGGAVYDPASSSYAAAAVRGTPGVGYDLGSADSPASWPDLGTVAVGDWDPRGATVQSDGRVVLAAHDDELPKQILLVRFVP